MQQRAGDPNTIPSLLEQDNQDVLRMFELDTKVMKMAKSHIPILAMLTAVAIIGMVTINIQQVSAPRGCEWMYRLQKTNT